MKSFRLTSTYLYPANESTFHCPLSLNRSIN